MPDPSPKQNPTESASAWQRAARVVGATGKLLIGVPALIFTVLAPVLLGMRVLNDQPVILPINVPPELSESGFTESVVAKRLIDAMSVISQEATSYIAESSNLVVSPMNSPARPSGGLARASAPDSEVPVPSLARA
jgi:hypothetical protein